MKRLIVCSDGTWNTPDQEDNGIPSPTNVFKIYNAIAERDGDIKQLRYYHPGVGSEGGVLRAAIGGAIGAGISQHIRSAYHWLGRNYEPGDQIFLFGFSRGAFTARSIGGFLGRGLLDLRDLAPKDSWSRVEKAYEAYRERGSSREDRGWADDDWAFFQGENATPVRFVGVWDTVGALGVPDDLEILNLFDNKEKWQFHNTKLGENVLTARHAMAIDEIRSSFSITRWQNARTHRDTKEVWFVGVHADVGGGYADTALSDAALQWMIDESHAADLKFRDGVLQGLAADSTGVMHNSYKGVFAKLRSRPRKVDAMVPENRELFHHSAFERQRVSPIVYPAYHPTRMLNPGDTHTVDVFADTRWNYSGLYLNKGHRYVFSATGEWQDSKDTCDWKGTEDGKLTPGDLVRAASSFLGKFETVFKNFSKNESTDFFGTKRVETLPWFTLVGAIANDAGSDNAVKNDGSPVPHQYVSLAAHEEDPLEIEHGGYLYCFPNDVWSLYGNNRGSVQLTIERVS